MNKRLIAGLMFALLVAACDKQAEPESGTGEGEPHANPESTAAEESNSAEVPAEPADPPTMQEVANPSDGSDSSSTAAMVARGATLFHEMGCSGCHGRNAEGGVYQPNPAMGEIPALNQLGARIGLEAESDRLVAMDLLASGADLDEIASTPPFATYGAFVSGYRGVRTTIQGGRHTQ
ncbi:MAG: c-type cytochrome, partial [Myxococcales bacterium]|nr:c-type cytochrome [Myxococcales bacterium]